MTWDDDIETAVEVIFRCFLSKNAIQGCVKDLVAQGIDESQVQRGTGDYPNIEDKFESFVTWLWNPDTAPWAYPFSVNFDNSNRMIANLEGVEINQEPAKIRDALRFFVQTRGEGLLFNKFENPDFTPHQFREDLLKGAWNSDTRMFVRSFEAIYEDKVTLGEHLERAEYLEISNPRSWVKGSKSSIRFCRLVGLPLMFSGKRDAEKISFFDKIPYEKVPPLVKFQEEVADLITETLISEEESRRRGLVILPTGSGKTRVTSESILKWYLKSTEPRLILWICHRKELCYQASETFERVWQKIAFDDYPNDAGRDLNIHRFWGDVRWSDNEENSEDSVLSNNIERSSGALVICTIDTLHKITTNDDLSHREALSGVLNPDCVVIDEAHRFETPKYRDTLSKIGVNLDLRISNQFKGGLIGLTATPYRADDGQMSRMHMRYGERFLLPDLISEDSPGVDRVRDRIERLRRDLQEKKILAQARVEMINFGGSIQKVGSEAIDDFKDLKESWLKTNLAQSDNRNQAMIEKILELRERGRESILFFGLSVGHSKLISMTLNRLGIRSESVDSRTPKGSRRKFVEMFRTKEIGVLTNYGIFDTGFDAPNVDAIVISRPIGSEVLLQQIVGRGLRGEEFGGTEDCIIVAVQDLISISKQDEAGAIRDEEYGLREVDIKGVLGDD